jgi:hypothetical protein
MVDSKKRLGLGLGIITRGTVSIKWMMHMNKLATMTPIGMFYKYITVEGLSWAEARNEVVRRAQKENFEWLLFIDDDVFLPEDAMRRLFNSRKDIVSGVYWTKSENEVPVIFEEMGKGPMYDFPIDEVFEIAGSGLGCCLINMKVFDEFDKAGIPYFKENWIMTLEDGSNIKCSIGEDHYFFYHAKKLGFKAWADSGVLCDHYDVNTKKSHPNENIVREMTGKKLKSIGRGDVITQSKKGRGLDPEKRTIVFLDPNKFSGDELERRAVGGAETAVINISECFATEFNTHVFSDCEPGTYNGVIYHHITHFDGDISRMKADLLVVNRVTALIKNFDRKYFKVRQLALWCHDIPNSSAYTLYYSII